MIHANKMILVPHGKDETSTKYMSNLDHEMLKILKDKSLPADVKLSKYNQALRRFQNIKHEIEKPIKLDFFETTPPPPEPAIFNEEEILSTVPKSFHKQANLLLKYVKKNPHLTWSSNGEMVVNGNKIAGSNIVDLINDLSRERKKNPPIGSDIFLKKLIEENIPKEIIVNKKRLGLLEEGDVFASPQAPSPAKNSTPIQSPKRRKKRVPEWQKL